MYAILTLSDGKRKTAKSLAKEKKTGVWIDVIAQRERDIDELVKAFNLHKLAVGDCLSDKQMPKLDYYEDHTFIVVKDFTYDGEMSSVTVGLFFGKDFLLTVRKGKSARIEVAKKVISERMGGTTAEHALYVVLNAILDNYYPMLDKLGDRIDTVEDSVLDKASKQAVYEVLEIRKQLMFLRKVLWPSREAMADLHWAPGLSPESALYVRDLYDHVIAMMDILENYRETLTGVLELHISAVTSATNEVIKVLTVISSLLLLPTLIASIYGMNFVNTPEFSWAYGYPFALGLIALSVILMLVYLKRKSWV